MSFIAVPSSSELSQLANEVVAKVSISGNPNPSEIICLAHFNVSRSLKCFPVRPGVCRWMNAISAELKQLNRMTEEPAPEQYTALYVMRLGLKSGESNIESEFFETPKSKAGTREYALNFSVPATHFAVIPIHHCGHSNMLVPSSGHSAT